MTRRSQSVSLSFAVILCFSLLVTYSQSFQSDELLVDDEDFGLEGAHPSPLGDYPTHVPSVHSPPTTTSTRRSSDSDSDSKVQFTLEHSFGDSEFVPAGTFSARLKSWPHGAQTLTKLRFSRNTFTETDKKKFKELLQKDEFYRIRLPSSIFNSPGRNYTLSSIRARCLPGDGLDEHIAIHLEGVNIVAVNYGSTRACPHPRPLKFPAKWSFNSHTILKYSEQGQRAPIFTEETISENGEGEQLPPPERSLWAKYWMYLIPLGLILMNAMTQAMNMPPEEQAGSGQAAPAGAVARGPSNAARRR